MRTSFHFSPNDHGVMGEKSPKIHERNCCFHVLYQIHWPDQATPIAELVRTMDELVRSGKVRYVGAGNVSGWQLQKIVDTVDKLGCHPWVSLHVREYSH